MSGRTDKQALVIYAALAAVLLLLLLPGRGAGAAACRGKNNGGVGARASAGPNPKPRCVTKLDRPQIIGAYSFPLGQFPLLLVPTDR